MDETPVLAAHVYDVHKSYPLIEDKHWHLGNQTKAAHSAEEYEGETICPLCQKADSQQHPNPNGTKTIHAT